MIQKLLLAVLCPVKPAAQPPIVTGPGPTARR